MARKNRPTLIQQFSDFINRVAPFDGNPLIQKIEHDQVETDLFDSVLTSIDSPQGVNNPGALFAVDFSAFDLYNVDTSGSIDTVFTITINNLGTGQLGRISLTKKSNDTVNFSNASFNGINNLNQKSLTSIQLYVFNVNGNLFVSSSLKINKSDSITTNNSNQLATSKAVRDLKINLEGSRAAKDQGSFTAIPPNQGNNLLITNFYTVSARLTEWGLVQFRGHAKYTSNNNVTPFMNWGTLPANLRPSRNINVFVGTASADPVVTIDTNGNMTAIAPLGNFSLEFDFAQLSFQKQQ